MQCNNELVCVCVCAACPHIQHLSACMSTLKHPNSLCLCLCTYTIRFSPDKYHPPPLSQSSEERPHLVLVVRLILAPHAGLIRAIPAKLMG